MIYIFLLPLLMPLCCLPMKEEKKIDSSSLREILKNLKTKDIENFHNSIFNIKNNYIDLINTIKNTPHLCLSSLPNSNITPLDTLMRAVKKDMPYWDTLDKYLTVAEKLISYNLKQKKKYPFLTSNARRLSESVTIHLNKNKNLAYFFYSLIETIAGHEETEESIFKALTGEQEKMIEFLEDYPLWLDAQDPQGNTLLLRLIKNGGLSSYRELFIFLIQKRPECLFIESKEGAFPLEELGKQEKEQYTEAYEWLNKALQAIQQEKKIADDFFGLLCKKKYLEAELLLKAYPYLCLAKNHNNKDVLLLINSKKSILTTKNNARDSLKKTVGLLLPSQLQEEIIIENETSVKNKPLRFSFFTINKNVKTKDEKNNTTNNNKTIYFHKELKKKSTPFSNSFDDQLNKKIESKSNNNSFSGIIRDCEETTESNESDDE